MNLEVFREGDTVWIRDTDTDDEWPLPADVWRALAEEIINPERNWDALNPPPVWGTHPADRQTGLAHATTPDGRATR